MVRTTTTSAAPNQSCTTPTEESFHVDPGRHPLLSNSSRCSHDAHATNSGTEIRKIHACQRSTGHPARRPRDAHCRRERLVSRRLQGRATGQDRVCSPFRTHDVPGFEALRQGLLWAYPVGGRAAERLDRHGSYELLGDRACELPGIGPLDGIGPHGLSAPGHVAGQARQSAGRGQERASPELREPPLRPGPRNDPGRALSAQSPLQLAADRLNARRHRRLARGHRRFLPPLLSPRQR